MAVAKKRDPSLYPTVNLDGLTGGSTRQRDIENLSKVQNARPLKPPPRKAK
jgi:hypothetical protein